MKLTVGDIRKAIEGLPDDAAVTSLANPLPKWEHYEPIRIKLLCGQDDALRVYSSVLRLLGHFQ